MDFDLDKHLDDYSNRKKYNNLNKVIIAGIKDESLEQAVIDWITDQFNESWSNDYEIVSSLPKGFQYIYATWVTDGEVFNGGMNQFFWNSSSNFLMEAIEGFKAIDAQEHAEIMQKAFNLLDMNMETFKKHFKKQTPEAFSKSYKEEIFEDLDSKYCESKEAIPALRVAYIRNNWSKFERD